MIHHIWTTIAQMRYEMKWSDGFDIKVRCSNAIWIERSVHTFNAAWIPNTGVTFDWHEVEAYSSSLFYIWHSTKYIWQNFCRCQNSIAYTKPCLKIGKQTKILYYILNFYAKISLLKSFFFSASENGKRLSNQKWWFN